MYFVDGPIVNITDYSKSLIPPPMSMFQANFESDVLAISRKQHNLLVLTQSKGFLYDLVKQSIVDQCTTDVLANKRMSSVRLLTNDEL